MMQPATSPNPTSDREIAAAYRHGNMAWLDQPQHVLRLIGFTERQIMASGAALLASGAEDAGNAERMIRRAGSIIAGLPLSDAGLVISQLRIAGLQIREIEMHLTDIIGEAIRQRRLAGGRP